MRKHILIVKLCIFMAAICTWPTAHAGTTAKTPYETAKELGLGWNLGNQLDAFHDGKADETVWGNPPATQQFFHRLAEVGFTSVRIPVTWVGHFGEGPGYKISDKYMERVAEVVGYAENAGLKTIINIHHDGVESYFWLDIKNAALDKAVNDTVKNMIKSIWTQIANRFKDKGDFLIFESMNEIHDGKWGWGANLSDGGRQYEVLNEWNQVFVDAVRSTGGNNAYRFLAIPGYATNIDLTVKHFRMPADRVEGKLMVSIHYYDPMDYTMHDVYTEWGHTAKPELKYDGMDEEYMLEQFKSLKSAFIDKGIPVYIGEMSCKYREDKRSERFREYFLEYLCKAAKENGVAPFYWDNGKDRSCIFDRSTGKYVNNGRRVVKLMKRAVFSDRKSYTLQSVYENAPR